MEELEMVQHCLVQALQRETEVSHTFLPIVDRPNLSSWIAWLHWRNTKPAWTSVLGRWADSDWYLVCWFLNVGKLSSACQILCRQNEFCRGRNPSRTFTLLTSHAAREMAKSLSLRAWDTTMGRKKGHAGRSRGFSGQPAGRPVERAKTANIPSGQALEVQLLATSSFDNAVRPLGMVYLV